MADSLADAKQSTSPNQAERLRAWAFQPGNKIGRGNPFAKPMERYRAAVYAEADTGDVRAIARAMIEKAKSGDTFAASMILDRLCGKVKQDIDVNTTRVDIRAIVEGEAADLVALAATFGFTDQLPERLRAIASMTDEQQTMIEGEAREVTE